MNILIIEDLASSRSGGAERSMRNFCEYLARNHQVFIAYDRPGDYVHDASKNKIYKRTYQLSSSTIRQQGFINWFRELRKLVQIIRSEKIQVINTHVNQSLSMLHVAKWLTGVQLTVYLKWIATTSKVGKLTAWGLSGVDRIATVSLFVADYWKKNGLREKRTRVIPEGIMLDSREDKVSKKNSSLHLCFAGRICKEKGLHLLLAALDQLNKQGIRSTLHIAGLFDTENNHPQLSYHREIKNQITSLQLEKDVFFHGYVDPLTKFLAQHDLVVVPSICQDAHPLVILEAFAVSRPVVASRVGGIPEILEGRFDEFIFASEDVKGLTNKIKEISRNYLENPGALEKLNVEMQDYARRKYALNISLSALESFLIYGKAG